MAPKQTSKAGTKSSYQEKGKRKVEDVSPTLETRRTRSRGPGIEIREEREERREENREQQTPYQARQIRSKHVSGRFGVSTSNPFKNDLDEQKFIEKIAARNIVRGKYLDFQFFSNSDFTVQKWIMDFGLYDYLCSPLSIYQDLVRFFYFYLKRNENGVYTSYIKGIEISFTAREFAAIMRLPYVEMDDSTSINISDAIFDLTADVELSTLKTSFAARELASVEFKILFAIVCNSLYPRGGGYDMVNLDDVSLLWCIIFNKPYCLVESMLRYMVNQRDRLNGNLPYAMFLTRLFKHFGVDLKKEGATEPTSYDLIGEATLKRMKYRKDEDGVWVYSPPKIFESKARKDTGASGLKRETLGSKDKEPVEEGLGKSSSPPSTSPIPKSTPFSKPTSPFTVDFEPLNAYLQSQFKLLHEHISSIDQRLFNVEEFIKTLTPKATDQTPSPSTEPKSQPVTQPQPPSQPPSSSPTAEPESTPSEPTPQQPTQSPLQPSPAQPTVKAFRKKTSVSKPKKLPPKRKLSLRSRKLKVKSGSRFDIVSSEEDQPMSPRRGSSDYSD